MQRSRPWWHLPGHAALSGAVFVLGVALVAVGVALLVLPGPGLLVIVLGLALLSWRFAWARHLLTRSRATLARHRADRAARRQRSEPPAA